MVLLLCSQYYITCLVFDIQLYFCVVLLCDVFCCREHLAPTLKGVSFTTRPAEKIGVVGRTGAGKSSLFMALFRVTDLTSGEILIDTVNIAHIGLTSLR
jgi:ABC-type multidrug transport system fused ATPase/permease subunit